MIAIQELTNELFMASNLQWLTMFKSIKWKFVKKNKRIWRIMEEIGIKKEEVGRKEEIERKEENERKRRNWKK